MEKYDFVNAEKYFEKAHQYIPSFKPLNAYLAYANNNLGNMRVAAQYYNQLMDSDSLKAEYIQSAVNLNIAIGDTTKALQVLQKGKKILPGDKYLLMDEANIYNNKRDYKALKPLLPALLKEYNNNPEVVYVAANCYDQLNEYEKAEELYLQAIEQNSAIFDPVFNLGLLYCKKSIADKQEQDKLKDVYYATRWLEKAHEILPTDTKSLELLKQIYAQTGNTRQFDKVNSKLKQLTNKVIYEN
jgi:tetratricopeptide (TPR) repeat protein